MKKLCLGASITKKPGYINADLAGADVNFDFEKFPYPFKDNYFDEVYSKGTLDHLKDYYGVMREIYRICKPNALVHIVVPFYHCANSFLPTHHQHFTYIHFWSYSPEMRHSQTPELAIDRGDSTYEIEEFKTIPSKFFRFIPDIKIGRHIGLRYVIGMLLGDVVVGLDVKMRVIKPSHPDKNQESMK